MYRKIKMIESTQNLIKDKEYVARFIDVGLQMTCVYDLEGNLMASVPDNELLYEMVI